ncbi:MAG: VanZ family protein [Agrobacterium sp.]|nr:VanZ family protein [Agrobacterium sp.]
MSTEIIRAISWILLATVGALAVAPINWRAHSAITANIDRLSIFAALAMLFVLSYPNDRRAVAIFCILGAIASEILPLITSARHPKISQALLKAVGALVGVLIGAVILQVLSYR